MASLELAATNYAEAARVAAAIDGENSNDALKLRGEVGHIRILQGRLRRGRSPARPDRPPGGPAIPRFRATDDLPCRRAASTASQHRGHRRPRPSRAGAEEVSGQAGRRDGRSRERAQGDRWRPVRHRHRDSTGPSRHSRHSPYRLPNVRMDHSSLTCEASPVRPPESKRDRRGARPGFRYHHGSAVCCASSPSLLYCLAGLCCRHGRALRRSPGRGRASSAARRVMQ